MEKYKPYRVGRTVYAVGKTPVFFNISLSPAALEEVGVLERILEVFRRANVSILTFKVSGSRPGISEPGRVVLAADLTGRMGELRDLVSSLSSLPHVLSVETAPPLFDGFAMDLWSFPLLFDEKRVVFFDEEFLRGFILGGWRKLGDGYGGILFYSSFQAARRVFDEYIAPKSSKLEDRLLLVEEILRVFGLGVFKVSSYSEREVVVKVYDGTEAKALKGTEVPAEFITKGMLAGLVSGLWGAPYGEVWVEEKKCVLRGDEYCETHLKRRPS
ncbi:4-vinyl reductase [Thermofilum pendens]|uniref:4-vinyl reductase, 4VR n=1 Tax=Thermofilum pendens (strain DSM 2475 / Hrk 5) TaxID=368408 RepID=A1RZ17_THEPD|nr:4-vinyl reductase [Thermofilum pendens]ABL78447.1 4-vinyl reductase, 4VR [Thermofilum pendens Hrk 5]